MGGPSLVRSRDDCLDRVLFGIEHLYPIVMPLAVIYGLAAGWVRWRTGSTFNTWIMHVLTDGLMFWAAFWIAMGH